MQFFAAIGGGAWSISDGMAIGLRPEALREIRESLDVSPQQWRVMFADIGVLEAEALRTMNDNRKRSAK